MALSPAQIATVRTSWALAAQNGPLMAELFYAQLFRIAPHTRSLFSDDMREQRRKLVATLGFVIENLSNLDVVSDAASALAERHVGYGVKADQYAPVGEALIWALKQLLGARFGPSEEAAWGTAYETLSGVMISHAYGTNTAA